MEEASGLGYDSHCGNDDGDGIGVAAGTGGGAMRGVMFVSAVVADDAADDAHDGHDENGNDIFQQSMPPLHQLLPPRPTMPDPYFTVHSQQHQQPQLTWSAPPHVSIPSAAIPNSIPSPDITSAALPTHPIKEEVDMERDCINPIEKARAIAKRFQQENLQLQQHQCNDTSIPNNINYAQLRHQYFQNERSKLKIYTLKNLEYIMKHEEKQLRQHVAVMNEMVAYEEAQDIQYQLRQEQAKQYQLTLRHKQEQREIIGIMNEGNGGIGSVEQRRAERSRWKRHQTSTNSSDSRHRGSKADSASSQHHPCSSDNTTIRTSLYLTNLPTDGFTTERSLQSLFCSYGRLDRVTMYRHRDTGLLKGDGLIVFGRDAVEEYQHKVNNHHPSTGSNEKDGNSSNDVVEDLVEAVCAQMNGAELPSGHIMGVQPAQMDYYSNKQSTNEKRHDKLPAESGSNKLDEANILSSAVELNAVVPVVSGSSNNMIMSDDKTTNGGDDDLDDFFASLE